MCLFIQTRQHARARFRREASAALSGLPGLLSSVLAVFSIGAAAQGTPRAVEEKDTFATPLLLSLPATLPKIPAPGESVRIDMAGTVTVKGRFTEIDYDTKPANEEHLNALKSIIGYWHFRPAIGTECAPVAKRQKFSVWFEERAGEMSMSVTIPKRPDLESKPAPDLTGKPDGSVNAPGQEAGSRFPRLNLRYIKVAFPELLEERRVEGYVEALVALNSDASIERVEVLTSTPHEAFGAAVVKGLRRSIFDPWTPVPGQKDRTCVLIPFTFCLGNRAAVAHQYCEKMRSG